MNSRPSDAAGGLTADRMLAAEPGVPSLTIREVNPLEFPEWDTAIAALPGATFFHTRAWAVVLHEAYGFTPRYLVATDATPGDATPSSRQSGSFASLTSPTPFSLVGLLPLMEVRSWLTGRRGISLPFTDACAPLATDEAASRALFRAALERGRRERWRYCEVRGGREAFGAPASLTFHGHTIDLRLGVHLLWARLPAAVCRAVRKAEANGVEIEFSTSLDAVHGFYDLLCRTRRRHGLPPQPRRFFDEVHRHVLDAGHGTVILARHHGRLIAGAVYFEFGRTALYKFGASDERYLHLRPNNLVMARAIEHYAQHGFETLDLGRTSMANAGLRQFKQHWNADESLLEYVRYDCRRDGFVTSSDSASGWPLFRHLPLPASRLVGALLYRHAA